MIHADWAGCYVVADHTTWLPDNYNNLRTEDILKVLKDAKNAGHEVVYWIDNEHDGLRGQRDLDVTVASWAKELEVAETDNFYLGMAREAGNSPLYVIEMLFYMNVMHPDAVSMDFEDEFFHFIDNFTLETEKYKKEMDIDNFFKAYGFI